MFGNGILFSPEKDNQKKGVAKKCLIEKKKYSITEIFFRRLQIFLLFHCFWGENLWPFIINNIYSSMKIPFQL